MHAWQVDEQGWSDARQVLTDAVSLWTKWATAPEGVVDTPPTTLAVSSAAGEEQPRAQQQEPSTGSVSA